MGVRNFLVEGVSGTGKTTVCDELLRRGFHAVHGDRELAYQGIPETGEPTEVPAHEHHLWDVASVEALVADHAAEVSFLCGGSRNFHRFIHLFDGVFVLTVDADTLHHRLDSRPADEFGGRADERALIARLHQTQEDVPQDGISVDATAPLAHVVDTILRTAEGLARQ